MARKYPPPEDKDGSLFVRLSEEERAALEILAYRERRTAAGQASWIIAQHVREHAPQRAAEQDFLEHVLGAAEATD